MLCDAFSVRACISDKLARLLQMCMVSHTSELEFPIVPGPETNTMAQTRRTDSFTQRLINGQLESIAHLSLRAEGALFEALHESEFCLKLLPGLVLAHQSPSVTLSALKGANNPLLF